MDVLKRQLKETFATVFSFYLKTANFHWNVEGPNFYEYHRMFDDIYTDVYGSIDPLAEHCRAIDTYTPASFKRLSELALVADALEPLSASAMISQLHTDNKTVIESLNKTFVEAERLQLQGLMNFLAARIEQHNKWNWFLAATNKRGK